LMNSVGRHAGGLMKTKMKSKVIVLAMSLTMAFTMMPMMGQRALADDASAPDAISLGADVLSEGYNTANAPTVYMADKNWRVIGYGGTGVASSADTMTLISAGILKKDVVFRDTIRDEGSDSWYHQSILQSEVEAIANTFSAGENAGIATRKLEAGDYKGYDTDTVSRYSVSNARLWPLSTKEAHYTLNGDIRNVNDFWWLRSPGNTASPYFTCHISYVKSDGNVDADGCLVTEKNGVRPAFNYKLNSVIFTSAAENGKVSGTIGADALVQVGTNTNAEWKVTVKSGHDSFAVDDVTTCDGKTLNVKYSGAITGNNEYISAIIEGNDGKIKYYGNLKNCAAEGDASGTAKVKVDGKIGEGDTLYVLNEQLNGDKKTDLASELKEVAIPDSITHDTTHHDAVAPTCTEDGNVEYWSCGNCEKNFEDEQGTTELTTIVDPKTGHNMTHHAAVAPTCTEDGTVEYWSCGNCSKNFGDEQGTTELTTIVDPKTGHKYGEWKSLDDKQHQGVCEHDSSHVIIENHSWDGGKVTKEPTITATGEKLFTCTVCGETKTETIAKLPKKNNTLTIKAKTAKVKYKKLRKKSQKLAVTKIINFTNKGQGSMTYKLVSAKKGKKSFKKYFKINANTGQVTIKKNKKMKKGTYKVRINVRAAGNAEYNPSAWKTVTYKIKVK